MGIQPIAGIQLSVCFEGPDPTQRAAPASANVVLLAQSEEGYRNLMRLASRAYFDVPLGDMPRIVAPVLADHREGLIALTGGFTGPLDTALRHGGRRDLATARLEFLHQTFGDRLYVEIQRHGLDEERLVEGELIAMADAAGIPLVATNEPFFAEPADYEAHDALLAIAEGALVSDESRRRLSPEHDFKTRQARWRCSTTCPTRFRPPSRSRCAAPTGCAPASRSCRNFGDRPRGRRPRRGGGAETAGRGGAHAAPRRARARARA